jgi:O-antigen ligase
VIGLLLYDAILLLPVIRFMQLYPVGNWRHPALAPAAGIAVVLVLYSIDGLFNAMLNPLFVMGAGGLMGLAPARAMQGVVNPVRIDRRMGVSEGARGGAT